MKHRTDEDRLLCAFLVSELALILLYQHYTYCLITCMNYNK